MEIDSLPDLTKSSIVTYKDVKARFSLSKKIYSEIKTTFVFKYQNHSECVYSIHSIRSHCTEQHIWIDHSYNVIKSLALFIWREKGCHKAY